MLQSESISDSLVAEIDQYVPEEHTEEQNRDQGNRIKYSKLLSVQWNKIEKKSFSQFEQRVLDTLTELGTSQSERILTRREDVKKIQVEDQQDSKKGQKTKKAGKVKEEPTKEEPKQTPQLVSKLLEICVGQELYLTVIRPKLVDVKVVNKIQEEEEEEEEEEDVKEDIKDIKKKKEKKMKPGMGQKKGGAGVMKKEDLMRIQLSKEKISDATMKMLQMMGIFQQQSQEIKLIEEEFLRVEQAAKRIKSLKQLELKFAALIVYADQLIKCHLESRVREEYAFELIYFLKNVYLKYQNFESISYLDSSSKDRVSPDVMKDVRKKLQDLNKSFRFSNRVLFNRYPRLVIDTDLNQSFYQTDVKPYRAQIELIETLANAKKPLLVFLNTMVGTGKTVLSVAITQYLQKIRDVMSDLSLEDRAEKYDQTNILFESDLSKMQILYCCPLDNVRSQVGSAAYHKKLQFAIASMWKQSESNNQTHEEKIKQQGFAEQPRLVNSWANKSCHFPTLVVSDFTTTLQLLKERETLREQEKSVIRWQGKGGKHLNENPSKSGSQYILFIDEPTVDADFPNAETTKLLIEIMRHAPPITILSSATLPQKEKLPNFIKLFQKRYGDIEIKTIMSQQFQIGCQIFSHLGHKFLPHYKVTTKEQLKVVLQRLDQNPFMQRCYNANAYCELNDRMRQSGLQNIENFEELDLITQEIVQNKSIELLKRLLNEDEKYILQICQEVASEADDDEGDGTMEIDFSATDQPKKNDLDDDDKIKFAAPYKVLKVRELAGKLAHKFGGGCLIAVDDPQKLVREKFNWLIKDVKTAQEYIKQYEKNIDLLVKLKEKKEKEIDNEDERSKAVQAIEENMKISIDFPDKLKINTLEHYKKYVAGSKIHLINRYRARKAFSLEGINLNLGVPDDILLYLFAGIATYTEKSSNLSEDYYDEVQSLASNGQLAFIVSDDSMCYGVNYPLNHIIVYDEMAEQRSMGALFQLIGRAGRVGVSWVANAYLEQKTFERLINYLEGKDLESEDQRDEAYNMEVLAKQKIDDMIAQSKLKRMQQQENNV